MSTPTWRDYHATSDLQEIQNAREQAQQHGTVSQGHSQVTLHQTEVPHEVYVGLLYTPLEHRGEGSSSRLLDAVEALADIQECDLVTHADNPWGQDRMLRRGWVFDRDRPLFGDYAALVRIHQPVTDETVERIRHLRHGGIL